jgi:SAM-dependent methyltransferase
LRGSYSTDSMLEAYKRHPLSRASVIGRLKRHQLVNCVVRELDLAVDPVEEITDQNHIGGALSTLKLASLAKISGKHHVLDLGCGLGGPARLLAEVFACTVHGVDANADRISDARDLTELVGLVQFISFEHGDFLAIPFQREYTVVWAQNTWIHVNDPRRLTEIARSALAECGTLAFEDVCFKRLPDSHDEARLVGEVCDAWRSSFAEVTQWADAFERAGFQIVAAEEDDGMLISHLSKLSSLAELRPNRFPRREIVGWNAALDLARAGVLGYARIVARLPPLSGREPPSD